LQPLFQAFKGRDYCFVVQPCTSKEISLVAFEGGGGRFVQIPPKPNKQPDYCLYMAHKFGMQDRIIIKRGSKTDIEAICEFAPMLEIDDVLRSCEIEYEPKRQEGKSFFVMKAFKQIVGYAILRYQAVETYVEEFDLDRWTEIRAHDTSLKLNVLEQFAINPLFESHARWILQVVYNKLCPCIISSAHSEY
jgi:hypothetical protein